jgi:T-complex protein 1 subunit delta
MESQIIQTDYAQMARVQREQRKYLLKIINDIAKTGANVIFLQKSILCDAICDTALTFLFSGNRITNPPPHSPEINFFEKK